MLRRFPLSLLILSVLLSGCAIGVPQNRDEFVTMYKPGGIFRNADHYTVNRPAKAVVADMREYSQKCLNIRVVNPPNYALREAGGSTTYRPKLEAVGKGKTTLSVQEEYNDRPMKGAPKEGLFTLVAEVCPAGKGQTQLDIYHASRGKIADNLKDWAEGKKHACPDLSRGW